MMLLRWLNKRWYPVDWAIAVYVLITGIFLLWTAPAIENWSYLIILRVFLLFGLAGLPPRGSKWERTSPTDSKIFKCIRKCTRFGRYAYPLALVLPFFQEYHLTVNALAPETPYWFEPYLYEADILIFGQVPAIILASIVGTFLTELMHTFYFSYYLILLVGLLITWLASNQGKKRAAPLKPNVSSIFESALLGMTLSYLLTFTLYPIFPARGPWEDPDLMNSLPPLQGIFFTPLVNSILERGAVSGGCFPSSHVSGAWGLIFSLTAALPKTRRVLVTLAIGMSIACIYTRLHHSVDVWAGIVIGLLACWISRRWQDNFSTQQINQGPTIDDR